MKNRIVRVILATLVFQLFAAVVAGAQPVARVKRLDLATLAQGQVSTRPGGPGEYKFVLVNRVPSLEYTVSVTRTFVTLPPLTFPGRDVTTDAAQRAAGGAGPCDEELKALDKDLAEATTEVGVKAKGAEHIGKSGTCKEAVTNRFKELTELQVDEGDSFSVGGAETLTVTVSRTGATWTYVLEGVAHGEWRTSYGFFFVPDRDEKYFTKEKEDKSGFTIEEQADREELDFVPTVLFTFLPHSQIGKTWAHGWTAGLGYDLEKPVLVAGYAGAYNENVIFTAGVAFHRQTRLLGRYNVKDPVAEALDSSQLVEDTYGPNIYAGVSFRFGENIHARREALEKETAAAKAEAAAAKARAAKAEKESAERKAACEAAADESAKIAKANCQNDDCVKKADEAAAVAKTKCAVTEQERHEAAATAKEKQARCDAAAEGVKNKAVLNCGDPESSDSAAAATAKKCIAAAQEAFFNARKDCLK